MTQKPAASTIAALQEWFSVEAIYEQFHPDVIARMERALSAASALMPGEPIGYIDPKTLENLKEFSGLYRIVSPKWSKDGDPENIPLYDAPASHASIAAQARREERELCNEIVRKAWGENVSVDAFADIAALREENQRLREALAPFSKAAGDMFADNLNASQRAAVTSSVDVSLIVNVSDFFAARSALQQAENGKRPDLAVGQPVEKISGYKWPGIIIGTVRTLAGETRHVVECTTPEVAGALHIFSPAQLVASPAKTEIAADG